MPHQCAAGRAIRLEPQRLAIAGAGGLLVGVVVTTGLMVTRLLVLGKKPG